jgi:hypothetical protein
LILPLKEEVTTTVCHKSVVIKKNPVKGGGFRLGVREALINCHFE